MDSDGCTRQTEKKLTSASSLVKILSTGQDAAADSSGARDVVGILLTFVCEGAVILTVINFVVLFAL